MRLNTNPNTVRSRSVAAVTHEGGRAATLTTMQQLERAVCSCLLWEDSFYESGEDVAARIGKLTAQACAEGHDAQVMVLAGHARNAMHMRHAPLMVVCGMIASRSSLVRGTINDVIKRADEPAELLAMLRKNGLTGCIPRQVRLGIGDALRKFDEYQLAKYDRQNASFKLRDVLRLCRPKPLSLQKLSGTDSSQATLWGRAVKKQLMVPDTWETAISAAGSSQTAKHEAWYRLLTDGRLGGLALLRNLRNLQQNLVPDISINKALTQMRTDRILPFRFVAAATHAPTFRPILNAKMLESCLSIPQLPGHTVVLIDVSGSMHDALSKKSDLNRVQAAACLGAIIKERCANPTILLFNTEVFSGGHGLRGLDLVDSIASTCGGGTLVGSAVQYAQSLSPDRIICITDEQSADGIAGTRIPLYIANVAHYQNGVQATGNVVRISGFSESVLQYIAAYETLR